MASTLKGAASTSKGKAERVRVDAGDAIAHANAEPAEPQAASESKGPPGGDDHPDGAIEYAAPALYRPTPPSHRGRTPEKNMKKILPSIAPGGAGL